MGSKRLLSTMSEEKNHYDEKVNSSLYIDLSDPPCWKDPEKYFDSLKSTDGPVLYDHGESKKYDASKKLVIPMYTMCTIVIKLIKTNSKNEIRNGHGGYYGFGFVLTALHVVKDADLDPCNILVFFKVREIALIYKAEFTHACNTDNTRDQAFIKLDGDTAPLGGGLHKQLGKTDKNGRVLFRTVDQHFVNIEMHEGQICPPNSSMKKQICPGEVIIELDGTTTKPGDSGTPVFNYTTADLIGIYRAVFTRDSTQYGRYTEISPDLIPWRQRRSRGFTDFIKNILSLLCPILFQSSPDTLWRSGDQAFIKLDGDTAPLPDGLHEQLGKTDENANSSSNNDLSDPRRKDSPEKCLDLFKSTNGPVFYHRGEFQKYDASKKLVIPKETPCTIVIKLIKTNSNKYIRNGHGGYYGFGFVLTALHVVKDADLDPCNILVVFNVGETALIYKAGFTHACNTDNTRDQAFIKLYGDTAPLGDGLHKQSDKIDKNGVLFRTVDQHSGNIVMHEGQIYPPNLSMKEQMCPGEVIIKLARTTTKPGDSGTPVFNSTTGDLIGVYRGVFTCGSIQYGRYTEIPPDLNPWRQMTSRGFTDFIKNLLSLFCSVLFDFSHRFSKVSD